MYVLSRSISVLSLFRRLIKFQPNLVFGRDLLGCALSVLLGYRTIFETHSPIRPGGLKAAIFRWIYHSRKIIKLVVITKVLKTEILKQYPFREDKIQILPDASDEIAILSRVDLWPGRKKALQVGYVGNLFPGKGMEIVSRLCPILPEIDFHIVGGTEEDISFWKGRIASPNIFFHGYISQNRLTGYINTLDICLLPNQKEVLTFGYQKGVSPNISAYTSPLKMFEYMAHGKVVVASDLPVLREVLNENNAVLVDHDNVDEWKSALVSLKDDNLRSVLGKAAFNDFINKYTWTQRAKKVLAGM